MSHQVLGSMFNNYAENTYEKSIGNPKLRDETPEMEDEDPGTPGHTTPRMGVDEGV